MFQTVNIQCCLFYVDRLLRRLEVIVWGRRILLLCRAQFFCYYSRCPLMLASMGGKYLEIRLVVIVNRVIISYPTIL